jgi:hypothetical protein
MSDPRHDPASARSVGELTARRLDEGEAPRRLSPSERLHEITMAALTRAASPPEQTVELTRNAKGDVQVSLTVRGHDLDAVLGQAQAAFDALLAKYPRHEANGQAGNGGAS